MNLPMQHLEPEERRRMVLAQCQAIIGYINTAKGLPLAAVVFGLAIEGDDDLIVSLAGVREDLDALAGAAYVAIRRLEEAEEFHS